MFSIGKPKSVQWGQWLNPAVSPGELNSIIPISVKSPSQHAPRPPGYEAFGVLDRSPGPKDTQRSGYATGLILKKSRPTHFCRFSRHEIVLCNKSLSTFWQTVLASAASVKLSRKVKVLKISRVSHPTRHTSFWWLLLLFFSTVGVYRTINVRGRPTIGPISIANCSE